MNSRLQSLFDEIEMQRQGLLVSLQNITDDKLNLNAENKWSVNQIIAHLISAELLSINYLKKKVLAVDEVTDTGWYEELKMILLIISQRLPFKYKAPKKVIELTANESSLSALINQWNQVRSELKLILDQMEDKHINRKIYKHIRVGMLNIQHALKFFREHTIHHLPQIKRQL